MEYSWKSDPRLKDMDPNKLEYLTEFSETVKKTPKNQLLSIFVTLNADAAQKGIHFSDQETELLVSILTAGFSPAEKKRLDTLKLLSKKLSRQNSTIKGHPRRP